MNELLNELGIKSKSISSGIIEKIKKRENIEILEKYDKSVLKELNQKLNEDKNDLFAIVQKRRMAYVEKVRRQSRGEGGFIDLSRDQDDTANLSCGIQEISRTIDKITNIIYVKEKEEKEEKEKEKKKIEKKRLEEDANIVLIIVLTLLMINMLYRELYPNT
jgi:hypothetical protein